MIITLNEVYYGKTPKLLEAEKLIAQVKTDYDGDYYKGYRVTTDKRWQRVCELLADEFGITRLFIEVQANKSINAMTPPISIAIECIPQCRVKSNFIIDSKGMKFKKEAGYTLLMTMYSGLLLNPKFSAGEVMAVILHEIGHNFQTVIDGTCYYLSDLTYITRIAAAIIQSIMKADVRGAIDAASTPLTNSMFMRNLNLVLAKELAKIPGYDLLRDTTDVIFGSLGNIADNFVYILMGTLGLISINGLMFTKMLQAALDLALNPLAYRGEK